MRLALFDLDGTVLRGNSWQAYYWWALRRWPWRAPALIGALCLRKAGLISSAALRAAALRQLRGITREELDRISRDVFETRLRATIRPRARQEIAARAAEGFELVLATAAFDFIVAPIAKELGIRHVIATRIEFAGDRCTGKTLQPEPRGAAKAEAVRAYFAGRDIAWQESRAYSDELQDLPLLNLVGAAIFVGPPQKNLPAHVRVEDWDLG